MRAERWPSTVASELELDMDDELFPDPLEPRGLLADSETNLDDIEPWRRLADIIGQVTGEAEAE